MFKRNYLRVIGLSVLGSVLLCAVSVLCLARVADAGATYHRRTFLLSIANGVESILGDKVLEPQVVDELRTTFPFDRSFDRLDEGGPKPEPRLRGGPRGRPGPPSFFWLVNEQGTPLVANVRDVALPVQATALMARAQEAHEVVADQDFWRLAPGLFALRLRHEPRLYLVMREQRPPLGPLFVTQTVLSFVTILIAILVSLFVTFIYLRRKSAQARTVLARLGRGELDARFPVKRFDEFGELMLDFNRMADEIERLVRRVREGESRRANLVRELGHDLRTPLTSLSTSFDNLRYHGDKMNSAERDECLQMIGEEVEYFQDLLEKLMTIATMEEPLRRDGAGRVEPERVDLLTLLQNEIRARRTKPEPRWELVLPPDSNDASGFWVRGDENLLLRLLKNGLDNASRFARGQVQVVLSRDDDPSTLRIRIVDDGPGLSDGDLRQFAQRREQRQRTQGRELRISLGLGSVIMKTIAELHGGSVSIANSTGPTAGAELTVLLPRDESPTEGKG